MRRSLALCLLLCMLCGCLGAPVCTAYALDENNRIMIIEQVIAIALEELGYTEEAGGYTKYADWGGENKYGEWCSEFASWCVAQADMQLGTFYLDYLYPMQTACVTGVRWFTERGRYVTATGKIKGYGAQWYRADGVPLAERPYVPKRGDLIYFEWYKYNRIDHVGIVEFVERDAEGHYAIHTIEGNNPDTVERFIYPLDDPSIRAYGVTLDEIGTEMREGCKGPMVQELQQRLVEGGYADFTPDGNYGRRTTGAVRTFQERWGLERTGVADRATQEAMFFMTDTPIPPFVEPTPEPTIEPDPWWAQPIGGEGTVAEPAN